MQSKSALSKRGGDGGGVEGGGDGEGGGGDGDGGVGSGGGGFDGEGGEGGHEGLGGGAGDAQTSHPELVTLPSDAHVMASVSGTSTGPVVPEYCWLSIVR